jgi:GH15 family glucan-1,4-alpha-glucosidase
VARYPNIANHGLIGDLQTAALVTTDGVVDWFCCPRFDSPSVFASLLDAGRGGFCRIAPDRDDYVARQLYLPDTAVLITRFMTPDGVGEVHDFMPVIEGPATGRHQLVRNIRVVRGVMRFAIQLEPRFDYGRSPRTVEISDHGAIFASGGLELTVHGIAPAGSSVQEPGITRLADGNGLRWTRTLRAGESGGIVLESMGGAPQLVPPAQAQRLQD